MTASPPPDPNAACPRCGAAFVCGADIGECWCMALPPLAAPAGEACLCPACLKEEVAAQDAAPPR